MILPCNTLRHPLVHNGTQQRDRLLMSLIPDQLKLDDRSLEELIAFAGTLSEHVRFWDENNSPAGDWLPFWESDNTSLFAIFAAIDLEGPRTNYRFKEIEFYALKKKEDQGTNTNNTRASSDVINELVINAEYGIYGLASLILKICEQIPAGHPVKDEIINIISSTLKDPLKELIKFHKAIDAQAIKKYSGFIGTTDCADPWDLKDNAAFECIDFVLPYEFPETLWKLFLEFYKALSLIVEKVRKAFESSLRSRSDHQPQITLFIAFLYLFKHLQDDLNSLTGKHLMYYYHDILQLEIRRLIPDKVHVVFEIATNITRYRITKGTFLKDGADESGIPLNYVLNDELVIANTKLVERKNLYVNEFTDDSGRKKLKAIALPAADKRDGIEEEWSPGFKAWHPLSGINVYDRINYKIRKLNELRNRFDAKRPPDSYREEMQKSLAAIQRLNAFSGFSISSAALWMNQGFFRFISVEFTFDAAETINLLDEYAIELSSAAGLIRLKPYFTQIDNNAIDSETNIPESARIVFSQLFAHRGAEKPEPPDYDTLNRIVKINGLQRYLIFLHTSFPSILPLNEGNPPFIRFRSLDNFGSPLSDIESVSLFTYSNGTLVPLSKSKPGILFRERNGVEESADELVITTPLNNDVRVRFPELFAKDLKFISINLPAVYNVTSFDIWNNDQWVNIPPNNQPVLTGSAATEDLPNVPDHFNSDGLAHNADGWIRMRFTLPVDKVPAVLEAENIQFNYRSDILQITRNSAGKSKRHFISYFTSLGDWITDQSDNLGLRPAPSIDQPSLKQNLDEALFLTQKKNGFTANGNLFLGFEKITPDQTLSLLFKMAEGTGNPDHYAPDVIWSYLKDNRWIEIPPQFILRDSTLGLKQTGILFLQIPGDINNGNTWIKGKDNRTDLYWLRASASEIPADLVLVDALPMLKDIYVNAAEAEFYNNANTETHLDKGILAGSISALKFRDVNVKSVLQPYASFDGRRSEKSDYYGYLQRVNERLRHKDRAVTIWDYERLILQEFPKTAVVKCVSHTRRVYTARPGHVTVAAIPFPNTMTGNLIYFPVFSAGDLERMKQFLSKRNSFFVGGYGDPEFCCCEEGCTCEHGNQRIDLINARFEPIRMKVCVRFYEGKDIPFYTKRLNEDLKNFLAPWANGYNPLVFGMPISMTRLLRFLENLDYVDVILGLRIKHFSSRMMSEEYENNISWESPDSIIPFTTVSVLTTYLDKLNEDNPNVIDHVINVIDTHDKCTCIDCEKKSGPVPDPNADTIENLKNTLHELWVQHKNIATVIKEFKRVLDEQVDFNKLKGNKVNNPEEGEEGTDAYRIEKIKTGNRINELTVKVAFEENKPFTVFHVINPNN